MGGQLRVQKLFDMLFVLFLYDDTCYIKWLIISFVKNLDRIHLIRTSCNPQRKFFNDRQVQQVPKPVYTHTHTHTDFYTANMFILCKTVHIESVVFLSIFYIMSCKCVFLPRSLYSMCIPYTCWCTDANWLCLMCKILQTKDICKVQRCAFNQKPCTR